MFTTITTVGTVFEKGIGKGMDKRIAHETTTNRLKTLVRPAVKKTGQRGLKNREDLRRTRSATSRVLIIKGPEKLCFFHEEGIHGDRPRYF